MSAIPDVRGGQNFLAITAFSLAHVSRRVSLLVGLIDSVAYIWCHEKAGQRANRIDIGPVAAND
jgi:hypothetical protein